MGLVFQETMAGTFGDRALSFDATIRITGFAATGFGAPRDNYQASFFFCCSDQR